MGIGNLNMLAALTQKMQWHQSRQGLLAENVANAEAPGYRGNDLKPFTFKDPGSEGGRPLPTAVTSPKHFGSFLSSGGAFGEAESGFEVTPEGNGVELEQEMMKVATNQMDYMAATSLYTRSIRIIKVALGRSA